MAKDYNVFISHSWQYSKDRKDLQSLLYGRGYFNVEFEEVPKDEPINSHNASYIKRRLKTKIENSNIVLGLAGMYANYSHWMDWELNKAKELGIPIVGVIPWGKRRVSSLVYDLSVYDVRWNTESIVDAIRTYAS